MRVMTHVAARGCGCGGSGGRVTTDIYSQVSSRRRRRECDVVGPSRSDPRDPAREDPGCVADMVGVFARAATGPPGSRPAAGEAGGLSSTESLHSLVDW